MNCQKFQSVATELARGQMMAAEVLEAAQNHRAQCSSCSAHLRDEEMLTRGLRSLTAEMNSLDVPASIETRLVNAFRQPHVVVPLPPARDHRRYWLTAVAALLLIVFGLVAIQWRRSETPKNQIAEKPTTPQQETGGNSAAPPERNEVVQSVKPEVVDIKQKHRPRSSFNSVSLQAGNGTTRTRNSSTLANHASNEIATEFMPLGYLNPASLQDGGQIVRVELPRTTLANFGFPVNMDRYNERVKADVLLGVDGVPHAIRFVQEKRLQ
jgi:hypothetical protein